MGNKGTAESAREELAKKKIDGEVWNAGPKHNPSKIDFGALVEKVSSPETILNFRGPSKGFSLHENSKNLRQLFAGLKKKSLDRVSRPGSTASNGLLGATPPIFSPIEVPAIFSPIKLGLSAQLSESTPESRENNLDDMECTLSALAPCTPEVCALLI